MVRRNYHPILAVISAVFLLAVAASCGKKGPPTPPGADTTPPQVQQELKTEPIP